MRRRLWIPSGLLSATLLCATLLAGARPVSAQAARLSVLVDSVSIGEPFEVSLAVDHAPGRSVLFPEAPSALPELAPDLTFGDAEVLAVRRLPPIAGASGRTDSAIVTVAVFAADTATVGPIPVRLATGADTTAVAAPAVRVPVRSVLGAEPAPEPSPLGTASTFPSPVPMLVALGALAALLLVGAAVLLVHLLRTPGPASSRPPPYPEALARLDALAHRTPATPEEVEAEFDVLRDVLRTYLARRLKIPVREATTADTLRLLASLDHVSTDGREAVRDMLRLGDLVAYAALRPPADVAREARATTRDAVEAVERSVREHESAHADPEPLAEPRP